MMRVLHERTEETKLPLTVGAPLHAMPMATTPVKVNVSGGELHQMMKHEAVNCNIAARVEEGGGGEEHNMVEGMRRHGLQ